MAMPSTIGRYIFFHYFCIIISTKAIVATEISGCKRQTWIMYILLNDTCMRNQYYLVKDFHQWRFSEDQLTLKSFPLDKQKQNYVRQVRNAVFSIVKPTAFRTQVQLVAVSNDTLRNLLDMNLAVVNSEGFIDMVSGNGVLPNTTPLSHRYGGHQFGSWSGQLGDGRAHLLGEYVSQRGARWELQLKGSGLTPYSRRGDGRAVIRSSVREFLASEAMFHLGLPTSRAATLVISDDRIVRDQFYTGNLQVERCAVVLRLAPSWFRFGSLQILADSGEMKLLASLVDFVIKHHFPKIALSDPDRCVALFGQVVAWTAQMVAGWQATGFTHGVGNTDNFSLLGLTMDYGPFRFMDQYDPDMVPNTSDDEGRYRFCNQPDVGEFNLRKLLHALSPLLTPSQHKHMETVLKGYRAEYAQSWGDNLKRKLGITDCETRNAGRVIDRLLLMMAETKADFTMTFRQLGDWTHADVRAMAVPEELWSIRLLTSHKYFQNWVKEYAKCIELSKKTEIARRVSMHATNPRYVLRNWIAQKAISAVENGDFKVINEVHRILLKPFHEDLQAEQAGFADPPPQWARHLRVSCSS